LLNSSGKKKKNKSSEFDPAEIFANAQPHRFRKISEVFISRSHTFFRFNNNSALCQRFIIFGKVFLTAIMKNKILLPVFYLPPISWFSLFVREDNGILLEQFENFPKQTYRNRAAIYGANGKLALIIPIKHNGKREMKDIEISYAEDWQKLHWKSIKTAYQSTPYFEFYEDRLKSIFDQKITSLLDFNLNALKVVLKILKTEKHFELTEEYIKSPEAKDFREKFSAKSESEMDMPEYYQSFSDKYGFIKDLSILDLLCNIGPESVTYLKNLQLK